MWADPPFYMWILPWGCAHLWDRGHLHGILQGKLVTGNAPLGQATGSPPPRCLSSHLPVQPYLLLYFLRVHFGWRWRPPTPLSLHQRLRWGATFLWLEPSALDSDSHPSSALNSLHDPPQAASPPWTKWQGAQPRARHTVGLLLLFFFYKGFSIIWMWQCHSLIAGT